MTPFRRRPSRPTFLLFSSSRRQAGSAALLVILTLLSGVTRGATVSTATPPFPSSRAPNLLRGPYLQMATPTNVIVRWRTAEPSSSVVRYGPTPAAAPFAE